ncbi:MAG: thermosome subunit [Nitrosopumilales archaeon CG15_BIG_FIL_POST_REV_8_21_14_020_37_12]|nr:MAG: thermosome subunit [Nitrosopumilales archaeon CG15_BIG_FIL_POST_REV_8_21_14_020_37_12]
MMKYPDLFNPDISRVGTQDSGIYNIIAGKLVSDLIRTSLGPRGMEKIYIDIIGEDTITKHGGAFLRKFDVDHPSAKTVIEAVNTVDTHVGDGTVSAAILIGSLLKKAHEMVNMKIPIAIITKGYELGLDYSLEHLEKIKTKADINDKKTRENLLHTCLEGKLLYEVYDDPKKIIDMMMEAVSSVTDFSTGKINVDDIKIEEKRGNPEDIELVKGTVIDKTIDSSSMPKKIENARLLLLNHPLETMRTKSESEIEIASPSQMSQFLNQENYDLLYYVKKIVDSGANLVISRKGINEFVQDELAKKGIISLRRVKYNDLWWLEKATGAKTCENIENISQNELGFVTKIYEKKVGDDRMVFVEVDKDQRSVTLLLRASSKRYLDEFHRNALNAFYVLRNFIESPYIVCGSGSSELRMSKKLREMSTLLESKEQIVLEKFAEALEDIPLTLARNVGMNILDTLPLLRSKNDDKWWGINSKTRKVEDMSSSYVIETSAVKEQILKTAVEATNMILNVDDVFMKDLIDNTHCHIDGTVHAHHDGGKSHNHFEQEGLEQRQMHQYY